MPFACLQAQHRMRPEISVMMRPIYDNLKDHKSVFKFERVKGVNKNIFFVDHQINEVQVYHCISNIHLFVVFRRKNILELCFRERSTVN